ncbi:hypothetical protein WAI453_007027 [Rhynchosporium graminicola]
MCSLDTLRTRYWHPFVIALLLIAVRDLALLCSLPGLVETGGIFWVGLMFVVLTFVEDIVDRNGHTRETIV